jgi:SAM-dependent methyltransferase
MLNPILSEILVCPRCGAGSRIAGDDVVCAGCSARFPIVDGIPVMIAEERSVFNVTDFVDHRPTTYPEGFGLKRTIGKLLPSLNMNVRARRNLLRFFDLVRALEDKPRVLVVGGAVEGEGFDAFREETSVELVETDVAFGPRTSVICDAHDLPFTKGSFDGVVIQAVLEHVLDPQRCVAEIERVLKPGAIVYAETPFIQQVHAGRFDFTRYTHLGHRRLFAGFEEIDSGASCGTGMALAWSYAYFLQSFFRSPVLRGAAFGFARLTGFWLKYFDLLTISRPTSFDAASSYYFLGRRSENRMPDRRLIAEYRGGQ